LRTTRRFGRGAGEDADSSAPSVPLDGTAMDETTGNISAAGSGGTDEGSGGPEAGSLERRTGTGLGAAVVDFLRDPGVARFFFLPPGPADFSSDGGESLTTGRGPGDLLAGVPTDGLAGGGPWAATPDGGPGEGGAEAGTGGGSGYRVARGNGGGAGRARDGGWGGDTWTAAGGDVPTPATLSASAEGGWPDGTLPATGFPTDDVGEEAGPGEVGTGWEMVDEGLVIGGSAGADADAGLTATPVRAPAGVGGAA
jgi:hypothetical protein